MKNTCKKRIRNLEHSFLNEKRDLINREFGAKNARNSRNTQKRKFRKPKHAMQYTSNSPVSPGRSSSKRKDTCPTLPARTSRQLVAVSLVRAVGKSVRARHILTGENGTPSRQPTQDLDDEELLFEQPPLRLCTAGAAAIEAGGDIVRSAAGAPGKLPKAPYARASS